MDFECANCGTTDGDIRIVEHGTDDVHLCKTCFKMLTRAMEVDNKEPERIDISGMVRTSVTHEVPASLSDRIEFSDDAEVNVRGVSDE